MLLIVSGEGPTDLGCTPQRADAQGEAIEPGPMLLILRRMVDQWIDNPKFCTVRMVSEQALDAEAKKSSIRAPKRFPGLKAPKETRYFFDNAQALGRLAMAWQQQEGAPVIAILFRDSDGTASAPRSRWADQWRSMIDGFESVSCHHGVPMLPKPKSEAWLLCALKANPYQSCAALENESGNDASPNNLKGELAKVLGTDPHREILCDHFNAGRIDPHRIDMPSFYAFKTRLGEVLTALWATWDGGWPLVWGQKPAPEPSPTS